MPGFLVLAIVMTPPEERKVEVYARVVIPQPAHTVDLNSIGGKTSKGVSQSRKSAASQSKAERGRNASSLYSALYGEVIRFNQAFWEFLLGSPVFIEANKNPIYSNTSGQEPVETYLCFGGGKTYATQNAFRCLSNETFVIVRSADFLQVGAAYALNRLAERNISLSVFFATSMTVTVMFYLGLLLYLVPAYLFRRGTSEVIRLFGKTGQANSISIAIAIGALPVAAILVTLARLI